MNKKSRGKTKKQKQEILNNIWEVVGMEKFMTLKEVAKALKMSRNFTTWRKKGKYLHINWVVSGGLRQKKLLNGQKIKRILKKSLQIKNLIVFIMSKAKPDVYLIDENESVRRALSRFKVF